MHHWKSYLAGLVALAFLCLFPGAEVKETRAGWLLNSYSVQAAAGGWAGPTLVDDAEFATITNGTDLTINLTNIAGLAQNDVVITCAWAPERGGVEGALNPATGWTQLYAEVSNSDIVHRCYRKVQTSTPDTSVNWDGSGNANDGQCGFAVAYRGANTTTPIDDTSSITATGNSTNPNPPSVTTTVANVVVIATMGTAVDDNAITVPTGYTLLGSAFQNDTEDNTCAAAYLEQASSGAVDPPTYTNVSTAFWVASTLTVRP